MAWYDTVSTYAGIGPISKLPGALKSTSPMEMIDKMYNPPKNQFQAGVYTPDSGSYQIGGGTQPSLATALSGTQNRTTPMAYSAKVGSPEQATMGSTIQSDQWRADQRSLAEALKARAAGTVPSAAEMQMQRGLADQIAAQRAQAASARGVSSGLAAKLAAEGIGKAQSETAYNTSLLRAGEQAQAEQNLASALQAGRGQDLTTLGMQNDIYLANAGFRQDAMLEQARMQQQANLANQQAELQNRAQMDQAMQNYIAMGMSREEAQQRALAEMEALKAGQYSTRQQIASDVSRQNVETQQKANQGILSAAGSIVGSILSDERVKKDIKGVSKKSLGAFLASLKGKEYNYKKREYDHDPGDKHIGVMAQALEQSKLGKSAVSEIDGKKHISIGRAIQLLLAGEGHLYDEISSLKAGVS